MELVIRPGGAVTAIYDELLDLSCLGPASITRASHVEPDAAGQWSAQILNGPTLGPFGKRSDAIAAEVAWLTEHRLGLP
jgi:hypothetical protein